MKHTSLKYLSTLFVLLITNLLFCQSQIDIKKFNIYVPYNRYSKDVVKQIESNKNYRYYRFLGDQYIDPEKKGVIDERSIKEGLNILYPDKESQGFIAIDIESKLYQNTKDYDKGNSNFEEGIAGLMRLVDIVKNERSKLKVGLFGIPFTFLNENQKVQNKDQKLDQLLKNVDYISPELYIRYPDKEKGFDANKKYLEENLKVALDYGKRLGKPVIPYVWYVIHPSNEKYGRELISQSEMTSYLKIIKDYQYKGRKAGGVIWWEPWKTNYKLPKELSDKNSKYLSKDEILKKYILSVFH